MVSVIIRTSEAATLPIAATIWFSVSAEMKRPSATRAAEKSIVPSKQLRYVTQLTLTITEKMN